MFERKTVFLIGAGANTHFGYPTNKKLLDLVREHANELINFSSNVYSTFPMPKIVNLLATEASNISAIQAWRYFNQQCGNLVERINRSYPIFIDHFLRDNPDLQTLGKTLIANIINQQERNNFQNPTAQISVENWVSLIANKMTENCNDPNDILNNKIHFITFNYDLSLERLLISNLKSRKRFSNTNLESLFSSDRIIHVYGSISADPFLQPLGHSISGITRDQGKLCVDLDFAYSASENMRLIDFEEKDQNERLIQRSQKILSEADDIYFLGYSFDSSNNKRLELRGNLIPTHKVPYRRIYITTHGEDKLAVSRRAGIDILGNEIALLDRTRYNFNLDAGFIEKSENKAYQALAHDFL